MISRGNPIHVIFLLLFTAAFLVVVTYPAADSSVTPLHLDTIHINQPKVSDLNEPDDPSISTFIPPSPQDGMSMITTSSSVPSDTYDESYHERYHHYDAYPDQMSHQNRTAPRALSYSDRRRRLSILSALIGTFYPLSCNTNLSLLDCSINKTSMLTLSGTDPLIVPCGTCYTFDLGSNVTLPTGLRVMGKLVFPTNYYTNIFTPSVVVQGEMVMRSNASRISPDNQSVRIVLIGTNDTFFNTSTSEPNILACNNSLCNLGKKPFVVAGGK